MSKDSSLQKLKPNAESIKSNLNKLKKAMVGDIYISGYTGYLGKYATCSIETEIAVEGHTGDGGYNKVGHDKLVTISEAINQFSFSVEKIGSGIDDFGRDEDYHWIKTTNQFFKFESALKEFFQKELVNNKEKSLKLSNELFVCLIKEAADSIKIACEFIKENKMCFPIDKLNPENAPSPKNAEKYLGLLEPILIGLKINEGIARL